MDEQIRVPGRAKYDWEIGSEGYCSRADDGELGMVDEAVVDGVESEFEAVGDAKLVENIVEVILHGLFGDEKLFANFLVAETLSDELNDFLFTVGEQRLFAAWTGLGRLRESFHDFRSHAVIEPDFAGMDTLNTFDEKIGCGLLENNAASAEAHGANDITIVFGSGENNYASRKLVKINFFQYGETVFFRHTQIEQENIGFQFGEKLDALGAILRFADDDHFFVAIEKFAQTVAEDCVIVRHENSNLLFCLRHFPAKVCKTNPETYFSQGL
jgi:hypothetical protein